MELHPKNHSKGIGEPFLIKEKSTGKWKNGFYYTHPSGKKTKYYYSKGLNGKHLIGKSTKERKQISDTNILLLKEDLKQFEFDTNRGLFIVGLSDKPMIDVIAEYVQYKKNHDNLKHETNLQYKSHHSVLKKYLANNKLSDITLKDFDRQHILNILKVLKDTKSLRYHDIILIFLKAVYNWLINIENIKINNPTYGIKKLNKGTTDKHQAIDSIHINDLIKELKEYNLYLGLMYQFVFYTLHRIRTITQIQRKDIDLKNKTIYLSSKIVKNYQQVTITIAEPLLNILKDYIKNNNVQPNDYLFGKDENGKMQLFGQTFVHGRIFSQFFTNYRNKLKKEGKTSPYINEKTSLYSAKHSGIKFLLDNGITPNEIIQLTGHTNIEQLGSYAKNYKPNKIEFPPLPI